MYQYRGKVISLYDADTITVEFDLGFKVKFTEKCRLYGIDTPELKPRGVKDPIKKEKEKDLAQEAKQFVQAVILGKEFMFQTYRNDKKGKFGRYLIEVLLKDEIGTLNALLIQQGYAKPYHGEKKEPWF